MSAVQQQDFPLAIRYFNEARTAAPDNTEVLFNLALAEAQIPGRELRSICWFQAYLSLTPEATNAEAVRQQISDLEVRAEGNVRRIIDVMKILAGKFPPGDSTGTSAVIQIACTLVKSGDLDGAKATIELLPSDDRDNGRDSVVKALANMGQFEEAKKFADDIVSDAQFKTTRSDAFFSIAWDQMHRGLYTEARQTASSIAYPAQRVQLLSELVNSFYQNGNQSEAMALVSEIKEIADKSDKNNHLLYILEHLAPAQAAIAQQEEALATLKRMDTLLPSKASPINNSEIRGGFDAHLAAFDIEGAKALIPHMIDTSGFKYKTQSLEQIDQAVYQNTAQQYKKIQKLAEMSDIDELDKQLAKPSIPAVVRIWGYETLSNLHKLQGRSDPQAGIFDKAVAIFPEVGEVPLSKASAANWIANIAMAANRPSDVVAWRIKALQPIDILIKTGSHSVGSDLSSMFGYYESAGAAQGIILTALHSDNEKIFQAGLDTVRKILPKCDTNTQTSLAGTILWHNWWIDKNFDTSAAFIKTIPDVKLRQQALDKYHELLFLKLLAQGKYSEAAQKMGQISDTPAGSAPLQKSEKAMLQRRLSAAFADAGDWVNAEKVALEISDVDHRKWATDYITASRAQGQFSQESSTPDLAKWQEKKTALATVTKREDRLSAYWQLCGFPQEGLIDEQSKLLPNYLSTALSISKPDIRLGALDYVALASERLGSFEMERHTRVAAFSSILSGSAPAWYTVANFLARASVADYLEQSTVRWHDEFLNKAIERLITDGNSAAALKIAGQLTKIDESTGNRVLMNLWIAQGKIDEARTVYDKIGKDDYKNGFAKSYATQELIRAFIRINDLASAKSLLDESKKFRDDEAVESTVIKEIGLAGNLDWAREKAKGIHDTANRHGAEGVIIGTLSAHNQDTAAAKTALKEMLVDGHPYYQNDLIDAMITAGNPQLALNLIPEMADLDAQTREIIAASAALARAGDAVAAKKAAENIGNNAQRFNARCQVGIEQTKLGDLDGARATFVEARRLDPRTSKDIDLDAWVDYQFFNAHVIKENFASAQVLALKSQDPTRRDSLLKALACAAISKGNLPATQSALAAITDPNNRAKAEALVANNANDLALILALFSQTNNPDLRAFALNKALNKSISMGNVSSVLPHVLALPDDAVKAYLLCDLLRAKVYLGIDTGSSNLLPHALKALSAMPADVWHALLLSDLAKLAQKTDPNQAQILRSHAEAGAKELNEPDASIWQQFVTDAETAKIESQKLTSSGGSTDSPTKVWANYVENSLGKPLFIDFKLALDSAANTTTDNSNNRAWTLFSNVQQLAEDLLGQLKQIQELRIKQSKAQNKP